MKKIQALLFLPFIPFAIIVDFIIGDLMTGEKTSAKQKLESHKRAWLFLWNSN